MKENLSYRPHGYCIYFCVFLLIFGALFSAAAIDCLVKASDNALDFFFHAALFFILAIISFVASKMTVVFKDEGIRITEKLSKNDQYIPWENLLYGYYASYRSHSFAVLSPEALTYDEALHYARRNTIKMKMCFDSIVVIPVGNTKKSQQVREIIKARVPYVGIYR